MSVMICVINVYEKGQSMHWEAPDNELMVLGVL